MMTLPIDLHHKIIEFALAFVAVLALARFSGRGGPPRTQAPPLAWLRGLQRTSRRDSDQQNHGPARADRYLFAGCAVGLSAVCLG